MPTMDSVITCLTSAVSRFVAALVKNSTADAWDPDALADHIGRCLDRVAAAGTAMELNTSGLNKVIREMNRDEGNGTTRIRRRYHFGTT